MSTLFNLPYIERYDELNWRQTYRRKDSRSLPVLWVGFVGQAWHLDFEIDSVVVTWCRKPRNGADWAKRGKRKVVTYM